MADEFETGICSGNWWSTANNNTSSAIRKSSPISCSTSALSSFGWPTISTTNITTTSSTPQHEMMMINEKATRSSSSRDYPSAAVSSVSHESSSSINVFQQDTTTTSTHHNNPAPQRISSEDSSGCDTAIFMDSSNLQIMDGFDLHQSSPTTTDWTQLALLNRTSGRTNNTNFQSLIEEEDLSCSNRRNFQQAEPSLESDQIFQKDWSSRKNYSTCGEDSSTINAFKQINHQQVFGLDTQQFNSYSTTTPYGCGSSSTILLQGLFEPDDHHQQHIQQSSSYENHRGINYQSPTTNYHHVNSSNELSSNSWSKFPQFLKTTTSPPKQHQLTTNQQLHFSNNASFWNASPTSTSLFPSPQTEFLTAQTIDEKPICSSSSNNKKFTFKTNTEEVREKSGSLAKKTSTEPTFKRPRIETPSPLPTFKVRKEKLGDRITALQQLVSPFGKTDTASVLYEAIEYIKFLHEQVTVLSNPYMENNGAPIQYQHHQISDHKLKDGEEKPKKDLRSRGLCLVPISSTFPVANETNTDFWNPTFGGTYR